MSASMHDSILCNSGKEYGRKANVMVRKLIGITNDKHFPLNSSVTQVHTKI